MIADPQHPLSFKYETLPSGRISRIPKFKNICLKLSFIPAFIKLLNLSAISATGQSAINAQELYFTLLYFNVLCKRVVSDFH